MCFVRWKQHLWRVHLKHSSPKPLHCGVTFSSLGFWLGLVVWGCFEHSARTIGASFTHRHRSQALTALWDRTELHANNTIHNLLNRKEHYLCSGCSPYSHPASCLNDEKFQQTTDSKQPSAETEHENGILYNGRQKPWAHHGHLGTSPALTPALQLGTSKEFQPSSGWYSLNDNYQHVFLRNLHKCRGEINKVDLVERWMGIIFLSWCSRGLGLKNSGTHKYRVWLP